MTPDEIRVLLEQVAYDLSVARTRLTDALEAFNALDLPSAPRPRCEPCRITFRSKQALAEHVYVHHDGPVPEHYLAAERAAGLEPLP